MIKISDFVDHKIIDTKNVFGGGKTGGGTHSRGFTYDSDHTTWEPGSQSWTNNYYGIKTCTCE